MEPEAAVDDVVLRRDETRERPRVNLVPVHPLGEAPELRVEDDHPTVARAVDLVPVAAACPQTRGRGMAPRSADPQFVRREERAGEPESDAIRAVELASSNEHAVSKTRGKEPKHLLPTPTGAVQGRLGVVELQTGVVRLGIPSEHGISGTWTVALSDTVGPEVETRVRRARGTRAPWCDVGNVERPVQRCPGIA